ncbi:hypothetical protein KSS87_008230, partial [Heliosperma pusillum]
HVSCSYNRVSEHTSIFSSFHLPLLRSSLHFNQSFSLFNSPSLILPLSISNLFRSTIFYRSLVMIGFYDQMEFMPA